MSDVNTKSQHWGIEKEDTEGTYKAPSSATSYVQTLAEGAELSKTKEMIERNLFGSVGKTQPRNGMRATTAVIPTEARASETEGNAPETDLLLESLMGQKRQTSQTVSTTGHTSSVINYVEPFPANPSYKKGDIVLVKEAGKFHVSPIKNVVINGGVDQIELEIPAVSAFSDNVVIAKHTTYCVAEKGHPSFSISRFFEGKVLQKSWGNKVNAFSVEGFTTGQSPTFSFGTTGLDYDQVLQNIAHDPQYSSQIPPIILDARLFMDGQVICINEFAMSIEQAFGTKTCFTAKNGKISQSVSERTVSGSIDPYMKDDTVANFNKFKANTPFSIFAYASLPSEVEGEFSGIIAFYLPNCTINEISDTDAEGLMKETLSFSANRGKSGNIPEVYIAFI